MCEDQRNLILGFLSLSPDSSNMNKTTTVCCYDWDPQSFCSLARLLQFLEGIHKEIFPMGMGSHNFSFFTSNFVLENSKYQLSPGIQCGMCIYAS